MGYRSLARNFGAVIPETRRLSLLEGAIGRFVHCREFEHFAPDINQPVGRLLRMDLKTNLRKWIEEDSQTLIAEGKPAAVPVHLLLVKIALSRKSEEGMNSASTELSLQVFERSQVFRYMRDLYHDGLMQFVDQEGAVLDIDDKELQSFANGESGKIRFVSAS